MRRRRGYVIIGAVCFLYWIIDSIWSYLSFESNLKKLIFSEPKSYLDTFLLKVPPYQTVSRIMVVFLFVILGIVIIEFIKKQQESEKRYRSLFEFMEDGFLRADTNGNIVMANIAIAKMFGYESPEEMIGLHMAELYADPNDRERMVHTLRNKGVLYNYDILLKRKGGTHFWTSSNIKVIKDEHGERIGTEGLIRDISDRKQAEQRVEHLNQVLRSIRDINQLIVREREMQNLIKEGCRLLVANRGYPSAMIILTDDEERPFAWALEGQVADSSELAEILEKGSLPLCCEHTRINKDMLIVEDRQAICVTCPIAETCSESQSLCAPLIHENNNFGYVVVAAEKELTVDEEEISLFMEMAGDLAYALNFSRIEAAHESSEQKRKTLENQLIQAQKMESVGRLAGGVAHDYNNISSIIIGYSELALEKVEQGAPLYGDLMEIYAAAKRSTDITRQLLAFARQQTIAPKVLDLNDTIGNMLKMLRRLIGEDINLAWLPGGKLWAVKIDPSQVDQILANLCVNARDAIVDVGKVTIETKNTSFDEDYCADHKGFVPGEYVLLSVSDDGCGIPPESLNNIFEPFFTTKGQGKGTGLGLATVYGIVKQNAGFINVYSEPDNGTSIKIYLPRHEGQVVEAHSKDTIEIPLSRKGEVVLLVEDDAPILKLGKRMLEDLGYMVLPANSPEEAINLAKENKGNIHLLITDVVMPEMNGRELSEQLRTIRPDLKTLFMSGYTANVIAHRGVLEDGVCFISKPFSKKDMAAMVREVLDEAKTKS